MQLEVAMDILDDNYCIIHQNTYRENEGKESDPVQGISVKISDKQRKSERHRHGDGHHDRFPPAEGQRHKDYDRDGRDHHVLKQLVGFFLGCIPVIASDGYLHIGGKQMSAQRFDFLQGLIGNNAGIGTLLL